MLAPSSSNYVSLARLGLYVGAAVTALALLWSLPARPQARAQENPAGPSAEPAPAAAAPAPTPTAAPRDKSINIFSLFLAGGIFMVPITAMSILAVTMTIERALGLRKQRVLPDELVAGLGQLATGAGNFDPRKAYRI